MSNKIRINPALVAALDHYAEGRFSFKEQTIFRYTDATGYQTDWALGRTCGVAVEILANEELAYLELKMLKEGMKKCGMDGLYKHIMGKELEA